jgi:hypothetical protein
MWLIINSHIETPYCLLIRVGSGVTNSPHFPSSAGYITLSTYDKSLPLKLNYQHNQIVSQWDLPLLILL